MPLRTYLILLTPVITAAGGTIALVWGLGIHPVWFGMAALIGVFLVRRVLS